VAKKEVIRAGALKDVKDDVIKSMINKGMSYRKMATILKCGYHVIYDRVKAMGLTDKVKKEDPKEVAKRKKTSGKKRKPRSAPRTSISKSKLHNLLITRGLSGEQAAEELGCSASTVSRRAIELGIRTSNRSRARKRVKAHLNGGMTIEDARELDCLKVGNTKVEGFIPHEGFVYVILENGLGFRFRGEFDLVAKKDIAELRDQIRRKLSEARSVAKIAGLVG